MSVILGIESSCDETAAAVVKDGRVVLSNVISSQVNLHKKFGGVVPEIASRKHIENISSVVDAALNDAQVGFKDIDAIAVTYGPGLVGALLVGLSYAKALAYALKKPFIGVNHIEGHICANYLENREFAPPFVCLVVSGGHTHIVYVENHDNIEILGRTRDDAAGEAFDKVSRAIGLGYPGGPAIDNLAKQGNSSAIALPTAFLSDGNFEFSFSGLKSSVLNYINKANMVGEEINKPDLAASFQKVVIDVLVQKTVAACILKKSSKLALAGGVSCNSALRSSITDACIKKGISINIPKPIFCTDNAAMIAACAHLKFDKASTDNYLCLNAYPNLEL